MLNEKDPTVRVFQDADSLSRAAVEIFTQMVDHAIPERKHLLVALSGGSTPKRLFQILAGPPYAQSLPWSQIHFFWVDERLVPPDHPESNFGQAFENLTSQIAIPEGNLHRVRGEASPTQATEAFQKELERFSEGDLKWPRFDLVFLGLGADGHTASLFPGAISPEEKLFPVLAVTADYQGRPAGRITLTPLALNSARNVVFMVSGKDKAHAVDRTLHGSTDLEMWPAQRIQLIDGKITWLLDEQAASR